MKLSFLGAADCVTGSRHLLDLNGQRLLLDCGLFQGYKQLRERNWAGLGVAAASIDAVLLSHAHLDHSGYIPALRGQGFKGQIFSTSATRSSSSRRRSSDSSSVAIPASSGSPRASTRSSRTASTCSCALAR